MGRKPYPRDTFTDDIATLARIRDAICADERRDKAWRDQISSQINAVIAELAQAPPIFDGD